MTACKRRNVIIEPKISSGQSQKSKSKQGAYWPWLVRVSQDVDHRHSRVKLTSREAPDWIDALIFGADTK